MKLTKAQREDIKAMFHGRCAYCGCELGAHWHADHVEPVVREVTWQSGVGFKCGAATRPEHDTLANLMPACAPCNIDKHSTSLEHWRKKLERGPEVLVSNYATYRHSIRFGLVSPTPKPVVFYFETLAAKRRLPDSAERET